jgi:hypothetical protein
MTVYVVQDTLRKDRVSGKLVEKFDLSAAEQFGELVFLLPHDASPFDLKPVINALHALLKDYTPQDYILCIGSPVLIGLAVAIAADYASGHVSMLQWSGANQCYFPARAFDVWRDGPPGAKVAQYDGETE